MAANLERLTKEWAQEGYPQMADYLNVGADKARQLGAPESFSTNGTAKQAEIKAVKTPEIQTFSRDQLILPETVLPQEVSDILQRAEKAGIGVFEAYHLSGVTLTKDTKVEGWDKKPEGWYWDKVERGILSKDASKLPDAWILVDKTQKPDYKDGKQLHKEDPFGPLLKQLRKDKKIQGIKGMAETSRFGVSHNKLYLVVLPEIAKLLGVEASQVRLPKEIEFNVLGNLKHPEWGKTNTWEWFDDKYRFGRRLVGGYSDRGGRTRLDHRWSGYRRDNLAFRPLVVVSPKS